MSQSPDNQPPWWESVQKILDNKLTSWGIPGIFVAIAADHAKNYRWHEFAILMGIAALAWIIIRIGSKVLPYFDQFLDWLLATQIPKWWAKATDRCEAEYFARQIAECREYQGRGFSGEGLDLENVFVPLGFNSETPEYNLQDIVPSDDRESEQETDSETAVTSQSVPSFTQQDSKIGLLLQGITQKKSAWRRLVILGAPGSGKTTLLRHITLLFALRKQSKLSRGLPHLIPVFLRLRNVTPLIIKDTEAESVPQTSLAEVIAKSIPDEPSKTQQWQQWFEKRLNAGKCLVMLDGLDEIADEGQRRQVSNWVYRQLRHYKNRLPFILSSRPQAYQQAPLRDASSYFVRSFNTQQRDEFLFNWYFNLEKRSDSGGQSQRQLKRKAESKKSELVRQIDAVPSLRLMAKNPLLLALIIKTYKEKTSLSPTQHGLYKQVCEVLLQGRQIPGVASRYPLNPAQKQEALQALALEMSKQKVLQFSLNEKHKDSNVYQANELIHQELAQMSVNIALTPQQFVEKDDVGVREMLCDRQQEKLYEFAHRTFQEYLTSIELTKTEHEAYLFEKVLVGDEKQLDWWRQTILFYAAQVKVDKLIQKALDKPTVATLTLAYECIQNSLKVSPEKRQALLTKVEEGLKSENDEEFKLAAAVQLEKRLYALNQDCFAGGSEEETRPPITIAEDGRVIWDGQAIDETEIAEAEYRLFCLETNKPRIELDNLGFVEGNQFCAWLSQKTRARFGEEGICYRQATPEDFARPQTPSPVMRLVRFRVPEKYQQLADYLAAGHWKEADQETLRVMLQVADREKEGYLNSNDILQFPCEDLQVIDKLWVQFSNGKFGFSVQKQIWLEVGGWLAGEQRAWWSERLPTPLIRGLSRLGVKIRGSSLETYLRFSRYRYETYLRFSRRVGWNCKVNYSNLNPNVASPGHLPASQQIKWKTIGEGSFLSRKDL
ncbi:MAG: GUN4 domain-containing protein [Pleurocapsa sp. MO_226.B13]|nr:GUN4 domain-containing protein [Pleurocapsa sp. MO_226.B13]